MTDRPLLNPEEPTYLRAFADEIMSKAGTIAMSTVGYGAGLTGAGILSKDGIEATNAITNVGAFFGTQATIYAVVAARKLNKEHHKADEEALPGRPDVSDGIIALIEETKDFKTGEENSTVVLLGSSHRELLSPLGHKSLGLLTFEAPFFTAEDKQLLGYKLRSHDLGRIVLSVPLEEGADIKDLLTGQIDKAFIEYDFTYNEEETKNSPIGLSVCRYVWAKTAGDETDLEYAMLRKQIKENPPTRRSKAAESIRNKAKLLSNADYRAESRKSRGRKSLEESIVEGKELEQLVQAVKSSSASKSGTDNK